MLALLVLSLTLSASAHETGMSGASTTGCGGCHGRSADASTTVTFSTASSTVYPGATIDVTVTVATTSASRTHGGLDVSTTGGSLNAGSNNRLWFSEITHSTPGAMTGRALVFDFTWTAPSTEGSYALSAAGNAVNHDGNDTGDGWNLASDLAIRVDDGCDDLDSDGVTTCDGDCDDGVSTIYPGATEHCDGVDEDCDGTIDDSAVDMGLYFQDVDGDGYGDVSAPVSACSASAGLVADSTDCDDAVDWIYPGAPDAWYDGVDANCDGEDDNDQDHDGFDAVEAGGDDCDDTNPAISPLGVDTWYDGVDGDCKGDSDYDADADGADSASYGGDDCDDGDAGVYVGAPEDPTDGVINDCALRSPDDADGDGHVATSAGGDDCDDANSNVYEGATETWYDGTDSDCDGASDFDQDGDGFDSDAWSGGDCDDLDADAWPGAVELWYNGFDEACDGGDDYDQDGDGFASDAWLDGDGRVGTDCDDTDPSFSPGAVEVAYDDLDQDCSGADLTDVDADGEDATSVGGTDCDDHDATVGATRVEVPYDGIDQDCTGADLSDVDEDGVDAVEAGGTDCDDTDPSVQVCDTGDTSDTGDTADTTDSGDTADSADTADDTGEPVDSGDSATDPGGDTDVGGPGREGTACGCATPGGAADGWLALLALAPMTAFRRRR